MPNFPLMMERLHAAGERDSEGGEEGSEKESSETERLLGFRHGRRRRVRRRSGKGPKRRDMKKVVGHLWENAAASDTQVDYTIFKRDGRRNQHFCRFMPCRVLVCLSSSFLLRGNIAREMTCRLEANGAIGKDRWSVKT